MGEAAAASADLVGGGISISLHNRHCCQWYVEFLGNDLLQHRVGASAGVSRAGEQRQPGIGVDAEHSARWTKCAWLAVIHADTPSHVRRLLGAPPSRLRSGQ